VTHSAPHILLKSDVIPANIIARLDAGEVPLSSLPSALGLPRTQKNGVYARVAKMVKAGLAPASLLRFSSIASIHSRLGDVVTPDLETSDTATAAQVDSLRRRLSDMSARAREAEERLEAEEGLRDVLAGIIATPAAPPSWSTDWVPHLGGAQSVPILVLSDWHLGETVDPKTAGGYAYNLAIAEDRVRRSIEKTILLTRQHLSGLEYPGIICAMAGDLVSGGIHSELAETDELGIIKSVLRARDLAVATIEHLKREFGKVFVPTSVGNHGRIFDKRPRAKQYAERNADYLIYCLLADHFRDDQSVSIMVPESGETIFSVYGLKILLTHGDQIGTKGGDGIIGALGPISRGTMKTSRSLDSLGQRVDHIIMGHWHQALFLPTVTVTGALKGPDEYSLRMLRAPAEDPSQTLMLVHPEHGITFRQSLFLKDEWCPDRSKVATDKRWLSVFQGDAA